MGIALEMGADGYEVLHRQLSNPARGKLPITLHIVGIFNKLLNVILVCRYHHDLLHFYFPTDAERKVGGQPATELFPNVNVANVMIWRYGVSDLFYFNALMGFSPEKQLKVICFQDLSEATTNSIELGTK